MIDRVLDFSDRPVNLNVKNSLLVIRHGTDEPLTVPLDEIAVIVASHPQISYTHAVLSGLALVGAVFVTCNEKRMPVAMMLPLITHSVQVERFAAQAAVSLPTRKRLWRQIVRAKLDAQARLLTERTGEDHGLALMAGRVRSGDPANLEAQAARIYWRFLFPGKEFRRDREAEGVNACLNYGYAVLRATVARALCAAGLHPSLGVHHHNRYDTFCLADDLMEPFRPVVDRVVTALADRRGMDLPLDRESKQALLEPLLGRFTPHCGEESRTLFDWIGQSAFSLAAAIEGKDEKLFLPKL